MASLFYVEGLGFGVYGLRVGVWGLRLGDFWFRGLGFEGHAALGPQNPKAPWMKGFASKTASNFGDGGFGFRV